MRLSIHDHMPHPPHIGQLMRVIVLPRNMTVAKLAKTLRIGRPALSNVLNGNAALSVQLAAKIEDVFRFKAEALLKYQVEWDLWAYRLIIGSVISPVMNMEKKP